MASEGTAAAENKVGELRRDPFAMLPFCGYNMGDYFKPLARRSVPSADPRQAAAHFLRQLVPQGRSSGKFIWPGYGDNSRVLKWIFERLEGKVAVRATAIGNLPAEGTLDVDGLAISADALNTLLSVDTEVWSEEAALIPPFYEKFGDHLPKALWAEYEALLGRLQVGKVGAAAAE